MSKIEVSRSCLLAIAWYLVAATANGAWAAQAAPLAVADAPARTPLADEWKQAKLLYTENFESRPDGSYPPGWRFSLSLDGLAATEILKVVRTTGGGRALAVRRGAWRKLPAQPTSGRLRIAFDVHRLDDSSEGLAFSLNDLRGQVDLGWTAQQESGPSIDLRFATGEVVHQHFDNRQTVMGKVAPGGWHRMTILADLSTNHYVLFVDGQQLGEQMAFHNSRWFREADALTFATSGSVLDNIEVHHLPGPPQRGFRLKQAMRPPRPIVRAHRLGTPPQLDGKLDDPAWKQAFRTDRFFTAGGEPVAEPRTEFFLGFKGEYLYMATRVWDLPAGAGSQADVLQHMRIYLDPSLGAQPYLRLGFDAAGNKVQEIDKPSWMGGGGDTRRNWIGDWQVATRIHDDHWVAEIRIPFAAVTRDLPPGNGLGGNTESWGLNVVRGKALGPRPAYLAPDFEDPNDHRRTNPRQWAILAGIDNHMTMPLGCHLEPPQTLLTGDNTFRVRITRGLTVDDQPLEVRFQGTARDGTEIHKEMAFRRTDRERPQTIEVPVRIPPGKSGGWRFTASVTASGEKKNQPTLAAARTVFAIAAPRGGLEARTDLNYYTHEPVARIRVNWWGGEVVPGSRLSIQFTALGAPGQPRQVLAESRVAAKTSPFVIELPMAEVPLGEHEAIVRLAGPDGAERARTSVPLVRRLAKHNEVKIRWDNVLIVRDEPFFPIFIWQNDIVQAHDLGANAARFEVGFMDKQDIEEARSFGIHLIAFCGHHQSEWLGRLKAFHDDPMMLAWMIEDEPKVQDGKVGQFIHDRVNAAHEIDPYHPTFVTIGPPTWVDTTALSGAVDAIGAVSYSSYITYNERNISWSTRQTFAASNGRLANWPTLQVFYFRDNHDHPTPEEMRHSIYSGILHGATGLSFWGVSGSGGFPGEDIRGLKSAHALWPRFKKTARAVRRLAPVIVSDEPVGKSVTCDNEHVTLMTRRWQGRLHVWVLNMRAAPETATLRLPVETGTLVNQIDPGGSWPITSGRCVLELEHLQPLVLRLEPTCVNLGAASNTQSKR